MKPTTTLPSLALLALFALAPARAQVPSILNYQGRVTVGGTNLTTNAAQFKFALVNSNGATVYWNNDGTTTTNEPSNAVTVAVAQGLYSTLLGDTTLSNMAALPSTVFSNANVNLRTWFSAGGTNSFVKLSPDQRLGSSGYALRAAAADSAVVTNISGNLTVSGALTAGQLIGGYSNTADTNGATVGGGYYNTASFPIATVGGGSANTASREGATVGGGGANTASGDYSVVGAGGGNTASGDHATIPGGRGNRASGNCAAVGGGGENLASGYHATIGGGQINTASGDNTTVGGGFENSATNTYGSIFGGRRNTNGAMGAFIGGGESNSITVEGVNAVIGGGWANTASSDNATIGGGFSNSGGSYSVTIGGGWANTADSDNATIGGGFSNRSRGYSATIGGGAQNTASGVLATIGGGLGNTNSGYLATIGGGQANINSGYSATIGGGWANTASDEYATIGGGLSNSINGHSATIGGGSNNRANGNYSTVPGGVRGLAFDDGAFVWSGVDTVDTRSTNANSFTVRAPGGARFLSTTNTNSLVGVILTNAATAWASLSDSNSKTDFETIKPREILSKVASMPVSSWHYKHDLHRRYIGPMAQDFHAAFGLGSDDKTISTLDSDGVMYAAIQGLVEELKVRDKTIEELKAKSAEFESKAAEMDALKSEMRALRDQVQSALPPAP